MRSAGHALWRHGHARRDDATRNSDVDAERVGATVFELGYPNRKADKFRHGEDYWAPGKSPKLGYPTPVWGGQMEFPLDFPDGVNYTVGKSQWATDWNYILPFLA